jgi:hypothetical protein
MANGAGGLHVINVTNPITPTWMGFCDTPYSAWDVSVAGDYAYVADWKGGLRIINITNPAAPIEASFYEMPSASNVVVSGNYAYVAEGEYYYNSQPISGGLRIINVTNPAASTEASFYNTPGTTYDVAVTGHYAYIAEGAYWDGNQVVDGGLRIINVINPAAPTEVGFYNAHGNSYFNVVVAGAYVYVTDGVSLRIINVTNPAVPTEVGVYESPTGFVRDVTVAGEYAYVADGVFEGFSDYDSRGLRIINVTNPAVPREVGFYDTIGDSSGVAVSGEYVYVDDGEGGLLILRWYVNYLPIVIRRYSGKW